MQKKYKFTIVEQYVCFLCSIIKIGDRIPSIKEVAHKLSVSIGMVQKTFSYLESEKIISLQKKGHQGTYLIGRSLEKLYQINQYNPVFCATPLPYTLRYEAMTESIEHKIQHIIPCYFMHVRGASTRIKMVESTKADLCIVSKFAFNHLQSDELEILYEYGENSYLERHVIVTRVEESILEVSKIGLDYSSYDQTSLIQSVFNTNAFELIDTNYHSLIDKLMNKEIDATILNVDEDRVKALNIIEINSDLYPIEMTEAVLISQKNNFKIKQLVSLLYKETQGE